VVRNEVRAKGSRRPRTATIGGVTAGLTAALLLSACGSSGASASAPTSPTSSPSTQATTTASSPGLAAAEKTVAKYSSPPTTLTVSQPLPSAPPKGKTVVFLQCEVQQCIDGGDGFRAAAAAIGWKVKTLAWKSTDPATLVSALQQALTLSPKPYAVSLSGLPQAVWASEEAAYAKANVLMVPWSLGPVTTNKTVIANILAPQDSELQGKLLADWFIADSQGKGKVLQQDVPQFPTIGEVGSGFRNEVAKNCPGCSVTKLDVTGTQVATNGVTSAIVSALQRDPSIGYVASSDIALAPGLPAALKAAGLSKVKILGGAATSIDEQNVREGLDAAVMQNDLVYCGWLIMDALLRHEAGLSFPINDGGLPQQILTKATVPPAGANALVPAGYPNLFKKLWQVG
jgi:ribose transport system substrate-binding protein